MRLSDRFIELMQMEKEDVANIVTDLENVLDEIEEVARTLGNQNDIKCRLNDEDIQTLLKIDDDLLSEACILRKYILRLIKQTKEGKELNFI